jgi:hypothetical protein
MIKIILEIILVLLALPSNWSLRLGSKSTCSQLCREYTYKKSILDASPKSESPEIYPPSYFRQKRELINSNWYDMDGCIVIVPPIEVTKLPKAVIHFVGGFLLGANIPISYATLLTHLGNSGFVVVATPIPLIDAKHGIVAEQALKSFSSCYFNHIQSMLGSACSDVPIIGLSHSLGGKITVLMGSLIKERKTSPKRYGNVFLAFNNFGIMDSLDMSTSQAFKTVPPDVRRQMQDSLGMLNNINMEDIATRIGESVSSSVGKGIESAVGELLSNEQQSVVSDLLVQLKNTVRSSIPTAIPIPTPPKIQEFDPSPEETWQILLKGYNVPRNVLFKFSTDQLDQSFSCARVLGERGCQATVAQVAGNHLTPCALLSQEDLLAALSVESTAAAAAAAMNRELLGIDRGLTDLQSPQNVEDARLFLRQLVLVLTDLAAQAWEMSGEGGELYRRKQSYDLPPPAVGRSGSSGSGSEGSDGTGRNSWDNDEM